MARTITIFIFSAFLFTFSSQFAQAAIVPCGLSVDDLCTEINEQARCTLSHFFYGFDKAVDYLLGLSLIVATLMVAISGFWFLIAAGDEAKIRTAKSILEATVIGLVIIFGSWLLISFILGAIGIAEFSPTLWPGGWWQLDVTAVCLTPGFNPDNPNCPIYQTWTSGEMETICPQP